MPSAAALEHARTIRVYIYNNVAGGCRREVRRRREQRNGQPVRIFVRRRVCGRCQNQCSACFACALEGISQIRTSFLPPLSALEFTFSQDEDDPLLKYPIDESWLPPATDLPPFPPLENAMCVPASQVRTSFAALCPCAARCLVMRERRLVRSWCCGIL